METFHFIKMKAITFPDEITNPDPAHAVAVLEQFGGAKMLTVRS
ncbi:MAG TPA: hypothetical protein VF199_06270 [Bacillales bacterium]